MLSYNPTALQAAMKTELLLAIAEQDSTDIVSLLCNEVMSDGPSEEYAWVGDPPALAEHTDTVPFTPMSDATLTITNKEWSGGVELRWKDIEDDRSGLIRQRMGELADERADHRRQLLIDTIVANPTGYDGVAYFHDTHPARGGGAAFDNLLGGNGVTTANFQTDINACIAAMLAFQNEKGRPYTRRLSRVLILAHPAQWKPLNEALKSTIISNTSNVGFEGINFEVVFDGSLSDQTDWYFFNIGGRGKPGLFQNRVPTEIVEVEDRKKFTAGIALRGRYNCTLARPHLGIKMVNS